MEKETNIERIQDYLEGRLAESERIAFEESLASDPSLAASFEQHKKLREGIALSALEAKRARLRRIHATIEEEEDTTSATIVDGRTRFGLRRVVSMASLLLVGLLLGTFIQTSFLSNNSRGNSGGIGGDLYGNLDEGLPFFESMVALEKMTVKDTILARQTQNIVLSIYECESCTPTARLKDNQLQLFDQNLADGRYKEPFNITLLKVDEDQNNICWLKTKDLSIQIPIKDEDFNILWNN